MSTAVMIMPGVQKPHCKPWCSRKASCIGCSGAPSAASPSIVLTSWPSAITASVVQDFTALPSRCTTQAPHCDVSQPTWVPVSRRFSRRNCTRSGRRSTLAVTGLPFTISEILAIGTLYYLRHPHCTATQPSKSVENPSYGPSGSGATLPGTPNPVRVSSGGALHRLGEVRKELVGKLLGRAVDQALAELGELAADLRLDIIGQQRTAILLGETDRRTG